MNYRQNVGPRCQAPPCQASPCSMPACSAPQANSGTCSPSARPMPEMPMTPMCPRISDQPIAMAYVPDQIFQSTYDLHRALEVGTIFPELHKPFCGKRCMR